MILFSIKMILKKRKRLIVLKKKHDAKFNFKTKTLHSFINAKKLTLEKKTSYYDFNECKTTSLRIEQICSY